uniref:Uncharacterized protein n=1 Tax=Parastrongyloides trichosuri TaxID=131310 RepID=A0A0N4ZSJ9_PARTI
MGQKQSYTLDSPNRKEIAQKADLPDFSLKDEGTNSPIRLTTSRKSLEKENLELNIKSNTFINKDEPEEISTDSEMEDDQISNTSTCKEKFSKKDKNDNEIIKLKKAPSMEQVPFHPEPLETPSNITSNNQAIMAI